MTNESTPQASHSEQVDAAKARRSLRNGFITLVLGGALAVGLLLAVPGLEGVARTVSHMNVQWVVVAGLLDAVAMIGIGFALFFTFANPFLGALHH